MTAFLPLYFLTFALLVAVASGTNSTYYPQYTPIETPAYLLPAGRSGSACTRAELNVSSFANQRNLLFNVSGVIDSIVCFGGFSRQYVPDGSVLEDTGNYVVGGVWHTFNLNDINLFDLQGERWYSINFDNATIRKYNEGYFENGHPMGRGWSSIFIEDHKMFVFGGTSSQTFLDSSVLVYDFVRNNWTILSYNVTAGEAPRPRHGHTATVYNGKAYIFGGYWPLPRFPTYISPGNVQTYLPDFFNDVWEFDMTTYKWTNISPSGTSPSPRSDHSTVLRNGTLWVFGGSGYDACVFDLSIPRNTCLTYTQTNDLWAFDLATFSWSSITPAGTVPSVRQRHAAALNSVGEYMMIFGGLVYSNYNNDIAKYYFATNTWEIVPTSYPAADPRYGASIFPVVQGSQNYSSDLFILMLGRGYMSNDLATYGELYAGPLIEIEPPPVNIETQTDTVILSFDRKSPVQRLTPIDQCGNRVDSSAVTITFASLTEISSNKQIVQQVNFQKSAYELNATIAAMNPAFNFGLNSTAGLQLALDFQLFGVQTLINYANESFLVDQSTNKWSFDISGWRFLDTSNVLEIDVLLELAGGNRFSRYAITSIQGSRTKYTFFSPVIAFSVVISSAAELIEPDGSGGTTTSIITIDHSIVFDPNSPNFQNPKVLFTFPYFGNGSVLRYDPDFGVVVASDAQPDSSCGDFEGWKIAVIVVTTILPFTVSCVVIIIVALVIIVKRSRRPINEEEMVAFERNDSSASTEDNTPTNSSREDDSAASSDSEV